jgi:DNA-directed RNA polymerase subunit RPC12/RpoP
MKTKVKLLCLECGKVFEEELDPDKDPACPDCGSEDIDLADA